MAKKSPRNNRDTFWLECAAKKATQGMRRGWGGPFGAAIVRKDRLVAIGCNTVLKSNDPTCHAEINAIRLASRKLKIRVFKNCTIYSTTEPCPMCFSAIHWARFRTLVFATRIGDVKKLGFNEMPISNHQLRRWGKSRLIIKKIESSSCRTLLENWEKLKRKQTY